MRVLVISDTHKKHENLKVVLERVSPVDLVIHLGDAEGYEDYIGELCGCPLEIVAGNNDFFSSLPREKEIMVGNYRVFMTHGHYYYVGSGIEDLKREALARGADVAMFGHTHIPLIEYGDGIVVMNPGSISYPRQEGKRPSYILMDIVIMSVCHKHTVISYHDLLFTWQRREKIIISSHNF
jgi:putative phosphoesterase